MQFIILMQVAYNSNLRTAKKILSIHYSKFNEEEIKIILANSSIFIPIAFGARPSIRYEFNGFYSAAFLISIIFSFISLFRGNYILFLIYLIISILLIFGNFNNAFETNREDWNRKRVIQRYLKSEKINITELSEFEKLNYYEYFATICNKLKTLNLKLN